MASAVIVLSSLAAGCAGDEDNDSGAGSSTTGQRTASPTDFSGRGRYSVGVTELPLETGSPVLVFYPAVDDAAGSDSAEFGYDPGQMSASTPTPVWPLAWSQQVPGTRVDAPASDGGPFPLVVFSHGWGVTRFSSSLHTAQLASWGYLVAVPAHVGRDVTARLAGQDTLPPSDAATITNTIDLIASETARDGGPLEGTFSVEEVAVEGHSAGGRDAALIASDARIDGWISLAGTPPVPDDAVAAGELFTTVPGFDLESYLGGVTPPAKPSMLLVPGDDSVVPVESQKAVYDWLVAPKRMAVLADTGHVVFQDGCGPYQRGELPGLVEVFGLDPLSETVAISNNGCQPENAAVEDVVAVWDHLTVAQLNWVFDIDRDVAAASLERAYLDSTFPGGLEDYVVDE